VPEVQGDALEIAKDKALIAYKEVINDNLEKNY
jgi:hypothetical protein